uniref:TPX2 domain-containing protein n=1 Tax=Steinernema glaseri TaxID=37863 RepID=A0A1I7YW53_9BILA
RENGALKLRVARSELDEEHKFRQEKRERMRAAEIEEECRAKNRKIEQMRDLFETRTPPTSTPRNAELLAGGSVARLRSRFNAEQSSSRAAKPPRGPVARQTRSKSASRAMKNCFV